MLFLFTVSIQGLLYGHGVPELVFPNFLLRSAENGIFFHVILIFDIRPLPSKKTSLNVVPNMCVSRYFILKLLSEHTSPTHTHTQRVDSTTWTTVIDKNVAFIVLLIASTKVETNCRIRIWRAWRLWKPIKRSTAVVMLLRQRYRVYSIFSYYFLHFLLSSVLDARF